MAILSGNTDLLEKAKLEKRIAALESERKAHNKGISDSKFILQTISHDIANNEAAVSRMRMQPGISQFVKTKTVTPSTISLSTPAISETSRIWVSNCKGWR